MKRERIRTKRRVDKNRAGHRCPAKVTLLVKGRRTQEEEVLDGVESAGWGYGVLRRGRECDCYLS